MYIALAVLIALSFWGLATLSEAGSSARVRTWARFGVIGVGVVLVALAVWVPSVSACSPHWALTLSCP